MLLGITVAVIASMPSITWKTTSIDLGVVKKDEVKELNFEFTNTTHAPIRILEAKGSCGCTKVQYPAEEIQVGASEVISANFQSGKVGAFKKNIRIKTSESEDYTYLNFQGEVVE